MYRTVTMHSRVIFLLTCCSIGWLVYSRHKPIRLFLRQAFEAVKKFDRKQVQAATPAQPDLEHLPMDVLLEIMALLELKEILRLRQVSTRLNTATHHRAIWYNLLKPSPARFVLRKRLESCSSQDLEDAYVHVQTAKQRWTKPGVPRRLERRTDRGDVFSTALFPGGRWLLKLDAFREIFYLDLDTPEATWHSLVPPCMNDATSRLVEPSFLNSLIDIDLDAEYPSCNIVIMSVSEPEPQCTLRPTRFTIWQVTPNFNDNGCIVGLKAAQLSVFEEREIRLCWSGVHLKGDFIAYCDCVPTIVNWKMANRCLEKLPRYCLPLYYPSSIPIEMYIIPKNQLFIRWRDAAYRVIGWDSLSPSTELPPFATRHNISTVPPSIPSSTAMSSPSLIIGWPPLIHGNHVFFLSLSSYQQHATVVYISFRLPDPARPAPFSIREDVLHKYFLPTTIFPIPPYCFTSTCGLLKLGLSSDTIATATYHFSDDGSISSFDVFTWSGIFPSDLADVSHFLVDEVSRRCVVICYLHKEEHYVIDF